jgi:hypothetical protein
MRDHGSTPELLLLPALKAIRGPRNELLLTQKYLDGVDMLARFWPGSVTSLVEVTGAPSTEMDLVEVDRSKGVELRPRNLASLAKRLRRGTVALGFLAAREVGLLTTSRLVGLPMVMTSEYTLTTEMQIVDSLDLWKPRALKRKAWLARDELVRRQMARVIAGLQCSGTPTYEAYRKLQPNALLFFDNRVRVDEVLDEDELDRKLKQMTTRRGPLRLVFGGRFVPMKGVLELPKVASELMRRGVDFTLEIVGGGPLEPALRAAIDAAGLGDRVWITPPLDFRTGWVPKLETEADLFLCCHPQGDPSSTYPEVMSCGVPIVGYANEAFLGVVRHSQAGWHAPMFDVGGLADHFERLDRDRQAIVEAARRARAFALRHAFEETFRRRAEHLRATCGLPPEGPPGKTEPAGRSSPEGRLPIQGA